MKRHRALGLGLPVLGALCLYQGCSGDESMNNGGSAAAAASGTGAAGGAGGADADGGLDGGEDAGPPPDAAVFADMREYWNLRPGNYWVLGGRNLQQNVDVTTKIEVEKEVQLAGTCWYGGASRPNVTPLRFTKDNGAAYWGMNSWQSLDDTSLWNGDEYAGAGHVILRFMMASPSTPGLTHFHSLGEKGYIPNLAEPWARTGILKSEVYYGTPSGGFPPYAYSEVAYSSADAGLARFDYQMQYFVKGFTRPQIESVAQSLHGWDGAHSTLLCDEPTAALYTDFGTDDRMSGRFMPTDVDLPGGGSAPVFVSVQAEQDWGCNLHDDHHSYSTREDWHLAKSVGFYSILQKDFSQGPAADVPHTISRTYTGDGQGNRVCPDGAGDVSQICNCTHVLLYSGPDPDCSLDGSGEPNLLRADQSILAETTLQKYYLVEWPLEATVAVNRWSGASSNVTVKQGETLDLRVADSVKHFSYEGYVQTDDSFFDWNGQAVPARAVFVRDGRATVYVDPDVTPGSYSVRFRPVVSSVADYDGSESVVVEPTLPDWSAAVTVMVTTGDPASRRLAGRDQYALVRAPQTSNDVFYPGPGRNEPFVTRTLLRLNGNGPLREQVLQGLRYFVRTSNDNGTTWSTWWTNTLYSAWGSTTSNDAANPHPRLSRPVDAYTLDWNRALFRYEERLYQSGRYWMRTSPDLVTFSSWYTDTLESAWPYVQGQLRPDPAARILGTSFTYIGVDSLLEEVQQEAAIYQRTMNDNYGNTSDWTTVTQPIDHTSDLGTIN